MTPSDLGPARSAQAAPWDLAPASGPPRGRSGAGGRAPWEAAGPVRRALRLPRGPWGAGEGDAPIPRGRRRDRQGRSGTGRPPPGRLLSSAALPEGSSPTAGSPARSPASDEDQDPQQQQEARQEDRLPDPPEVCGRPQGQPASARPSRRLLIAGLPAGRPPRARAGAPPLRTPTRRLRRPRGRRPLGRTASGPLIGEPGRASPGRPRGGATGPDGGPGSCSRILRPWLEAGPRLPVGRARRRRWSRAR